ncbi:hypothetical protein Tco_1047082, partial [Tanacetum coccineum]
LRTAVRGRTLSLLSFPFEVQPPLIANPGSAPVHRCNKAAKKLTECTRPRNAPLEKDPLKM